MAFVVPGISGEGIRGCVQHTNPINMHSSLPTLHGRHQVVAQRRAVSLSPCLRASSNSWQQSNNNDEMTRQQAYDGPTHGFSLIYNSSVPHSTLANNRDAMGMNSTMTQITFSLKTTCMFPSCTSRSRPLGPVRGSGGRLER